MFVGSRKTTPNPSPYGSRSFKSLSWLVSLPRQVINFFSCEEPKFHINVASGGQKPFREKVSGLPKAFDKYNKNL